MLILHQKKAEIVANIVDINILIITLTMNGLNTLIKRQRLSEQIKNKNKKTPDPTIFCVLKTKSTLNIDIKTYIYIH